MKIITIMLLILSCYKLNAQQFELDSISIPDDFENIFVTQISGDSLSTSFLIVIKHEVKLHKHLEHTEHVYVLEGEGMLQLGEKSLTIKSGDFVFIPKNTAHKVITNSTIPLKVISIQSPAFDGSDRIQLE